MPRFRHKELAKTLRIIQWRHFVPAYDTWFDNTYTKVWGRKNDTEVIVDHINLTDLPARAASEVAARSGHDIFQHLSPPAAFEDQVINLKDVVQDVTKKLGPMKGLARRSTYNPKTKKWFGMADNYVPDPVHYRRDWWGEAGVRPTTWDNVLKGAAKLKADGHPIGIGMSNELDSNMALIALMQCFGAYIQNADAQVTLNTKQTRDAVQYMANLYRRGMTSDVFAWVPASNNNAFLAGRISLAFNAISILRTAEGQNPALAQNTAILPIPRGPKQALGLEHVMGVHTIWKFAQEKALAKKYIRDQQLQYIGHFLNSKFYNFPAWPRAVPNIKKKLARDPSGKYTVLDKISRTATTNVGFPGYSNAAIDEVFNTFLIPQMFAEVAQGNKSAAESVRDTTNEVRRIFRKWRGRGKI
ncbi:MAG TPA: extracellular solute-binding protein [Gaiellaceae bacterium]|nr:extracellular solute-binding protein [Gaiellaceae bacterium]